MNHSFETVFYAYIEHYSAVSRSAKTEPTAMPTEEFYLYCGANLPQARKIVMMGRSNS